MQPRLQHAYFKALAPALVQLKARMVGVVPPQRPLAVTQVPQPVFPGAMAELLAAEAAYQPPTSIDVGVRVVRKQHVEWGVGQVTAAGGSSGAWVVHWPERRHDSATLRPAWQPSWPTC